MKNKINILLLFSLLCHYTNAQICDGNLGDNILPFGDFGSGVDNVLQTDPGISPDYIYDTNVPPEDGSYVISADLSLWSSIFEWLEITDNSANPNGYMMVVNSSFEPGLFFEQEINNLCENTFYEFSVDIFNLKPIGSNSVRPNLSFLLDNTEVFESGDVPENAEWNRYGFTFLTDPGQTSIVLSLRNNAPGGSGNDFAMDNISFRPCGPDALILPAEMENICEGENPIIFEAILNGDQYSTPVYQWQQSFDGGLTWENIAGENSTTFEPINLMEGVHYFRFVVANTPASVQNPQCRIISNVKIINFTPKFYDLKDTICAGLIFPFGDEFYTETGMYADSFTTANGCDSILRLDLTVIEDSGLFAGFSTAGLDCEEDDNGIILIDSVGNGTGPFSVWVNDVPYEFGNSISDLTEGGYSITIEDNYGCLLDTMVDLVRLEPWEIDLGEDVVLVLGDEVQITPFIGTTELTYAWTPADLIDCDAECELINLLPEESVKISLVATSLSGCTQTDTLCIEVLKERKIYFPNAFSPNSDGANDFFTVYGAAPNLEMIESLIIFDRWGNLVYSKRDFLPNEISVAWDGTFRGQKLPNGIYAYVAKARFLDGVVIAYHGDVLLVD